MSEQCTFHSPPTRNAYFCRPFVSDSLNGQLGAKKVVKADKVVQARMTGRDMEFAKDGRGAGPCTAWLIGHEAHRIGFGAATLDDEDPWLCVNGGTPVSQADEKSPARVQLAGEAERSSRFERPGQMQHAIPGGRLAMTEVEEATAEVQQHLGLRGVAFHHSEFGSCFLFARYALFGEEQFTRFGQGPASNRTLQRHSHLSCSVAIRNLLLLYSRCEIDQRGFKVAYQRSFTRRILPVSKETKAELVSNACQASDMFSKDGLPETS
jgi:hypothetical protein